MLECGALQHPLLLYFRGNGQKNTKIVRIAEEGVAAVGTFDDGKLPVGQSYRVLQDWVLQS